MLPLLWCEEDVLDAGRLLLLLFVANGMLLSLVVGGGGAASSADGLPSSASPPLLTLLFWTGWFDWMLTQSEGLRWRRRRNS